MIQVIKTLEELEALKKNWEKLFAQASAKASLENGYNIKNATRGGKLEFFPRVVFDSLF